MLIAESLQKIHREYAGDMDYPEEGSEDLSLRLDYVDDCIDEYESCTDEGYCFKELITSTPFTFNGTGSDDLPGNFLNFIRRFNTFEGGALKAKLQIGPTEYTEVSSGEGEYMAQSGISGNVFWRAGNKLRTLPSASGSFVLPYLKKHPRYVTGSETDEILMQRPKFIQYFVLAKLHYKNSDPDEGDASMSAANEEFKKMRYNALI